jgi:hypothetical protein
MGAGRAYSYFAFIFHEIESQSELLSSGQWKFGPCSPGEDVFEAEELAILCNGRSIKLAAACSSVFLSSGSAIALRTRAVWISSSISGCSARAAGSETKKEGSSLPPTTTICRFVGEVLQRISVILNRPSNGSFAYRVFKNSWKAFDRSATVESKARSTLCFVCSEVMLSESECVCASRRLAMRSEILPKMNRKHVPMPVVTVLVCATQPSSWC